MCFEDDFILFLNWCKNNKKHCISHESEFWYGVTKMMHELAINYSEYGEIISLYILQLEKECLKLKKIEQSKENKKQLEINLKNL